MKMSGGNAGEGTMSRLKDKIAVVTGASKGIGAGIAKALASEGAAVVVNYSSARSDADKVVSDIRSQGGKAIAVQADVSKTADVQRLFAETKKAFGKLDVLVNNAGVYEFAPIGDFTEEQFRRLFDTNVLGVLLASRTPRTLVSNSREAAKYFGDSGGTIINIGSAITHVTPPSSSVYTGTKAAVDAITRVLAKELGPKGIRVNSINPGMVETEGVHAAGFIGSEFEKGAVAQTPLGRIGQTDDIAPIALFLASHDSAWVTGETLIASGGLR